MERVAGALRRKRIGVVAHYYMDPEVQGVLAAVRERGGWEHVHISDSLVMADAAVAMAESGCEAVCVLGVDFMSENVRAILDGAGFAHVPVLRMAAEEIGCTLADAADSEAYAAYLASAAAEGPGLHVVYINTSLHTKAAADELVPTITCTSSNVVQTILQAALQAPEAHVWFGPDTHMGGNLVKLFQLLAEGTDADVAEYHPGHTAASIRALLPRLHHFMDGTCAVHDIFGGEVARLVGEGYGDAYISAHFEVPGAMFDLSMRAKRERGMGVVGSTKNILDFIRAKLDETLDAGAEPQDGPLQFVLGTETGMTTSIVEAVQGLLRARGSDLEVEIVFPVSSQAITTPATAAGAVDFLGLEVLPGVPAGEGCSSEGGCASCPYMKMNSLAALQAIADRVGTEREGELAPFAARRYTELVGGLTLGEAGSRSILCMRDFQKSGELPQRLLDRVHAMEPGKKPGGHSAMAR